MHVKIKSPTHERYKLIPNNVSNLATDRAK
jgi:hypothetical protein